MIKKSIVGKNDLTILLPQILIRSLIQNFDEVDFLDNQYNVTIHTDSYFKDQDILLYDFVCITDNTFVPTIDCYDVVKSLFLQRVLCASPSYIDLHGEPKDIKDLEKNHKIINHSYDKSHYLDFENEQSIKINSDITVNNLNIYTDLLVSGSGIGRLSSHTLNQEEYFEKGLLVPVLSQYKLAPYKFIFLKLKQSKSPKIIESIIKVLDNNFELK